MEKKTVSHIKSTYNQIIFDLSPLPSGRQTWLEHPLDLALWMGSTKETGSFSAIYISWLPGGYPNIHSNMNCIHSPKWYVVVSINLGTPISWMVYFMEKLLFLSGWFGDTLISGNLWTKICCHAGKRKHSDHHHDLHLRDEVLCKKGSQQM